MAYSDYGGFAYRNGKKVEERSDCEINRETVIGHPGEWPGIHNVLNKTNWPYHHVVLGDGPIFLGLSKQSYANLYDLADSMEGSDIKTIDLAECLSRKVPEALGDYEGEPYIETDYFREKGVPYVGAYKTWRIEIFYTEEDNYYQYCRVEQPDGVIWCGWAGYGVGAGLEDGGHGYSSEARDEMLTNYWPDAIK